MPQASPLFCDDIIVAPLGSGSRGNCTFVGTAEKGVLIDCGLSTKQILLRMDEIGLSGAHIEGVLITHEHSDHASASRIFERRMKKTQDVAPSFFMTQGTQESLNAKVIPEHITTITANRSFRIGNWNIEPASVPHDTLDPVAYFLEHEGIRVGVITDLGKQTHLITEQLSTLDIAVVEFNHDLEMLLEGDYPWETKQRVRSSHGHLSNQQAYALVRDGASSRLKHLILGHLSQENNTPEKAYERACEALFDGKQCKAQVTLAEQSHPVGPMRVNRKEALIHSATRRSHRESEIAVPNTESNQIQLFDPIDSSS